MSLFVSCFSSSFHFGVSFPEGFSRFTLTLRFRFLSLFVTDSVSYLHNNKKSNQSECIRWVNSHCREQMPVSHMSAVEKTKTGKKQNHPRPPAPLSCQSCSCIFFVFCAGGKARVSGAVHRCCLLGAGAHRDLSRLNIFVQNQ